MVVFAFRILPHLEDKGVEPLVHPADRSVLIGEVRPLVEIIRAGKDFLRLLETYSSLGIRSQPLALSRVKTESHSDITLIPQSSAA